MSFPLVREHLPTKLRMYGRTFNLNLDFRTVLSLGDIYSNQFISDTDKLKYSLQLLISKHNRWKLFGLSFMKRAELLQAISEDFLMDPADKEKINAPASTSSDAKEKSFSQPKSIDIDFDAEPIYAAFRQSYQIDLQDSRVIDFRVFRALLSNLPADTRMSEIVDIRVKPIPEPNKHNAKEIAALKKAKAKVAIKMTEEEAQDNFQQDVEVLTDKLVAMIKPKGGD